MDKKKSSFIMSFLAQYKRSRMLKNLLASGVIGRGTDAAAISEMCESLIRYVETGEYDKDKAYPNGYQSAR